MGLLIPRPAEPPKGNELTILFWIIVVPVAGFGVVCLYFGYTAPADRGAEAAKLIRGGYAYIAGAAIAVLIRHFFTGFKA